MQKRRPRQWQIMFMLEMCRQSHHRLTIPWGLGRPCDVHLSKWMSTENTNTATVTGTKGRCLSTNRHDDGDVAQPAVHRPLNPGNRIFRLTARMPEAGSRRLCMEFSSSVPSEPNPHDRGASCAQHYLRLFFTHGSTI